MLTDVRITDSTVSIVKAATPADDVIALINAIGTPVTLDSESKIIAAREPTTPFLRGKGQGYKLCRSHRGRNRA